MGFFVIFIDMRKLIKKLLREGLSEATMDSDDHTVTRIRQRLAAFPNEDVSMEVKEQVQTNLQAILDTDFSKKKDFAVLLGTTEVNPKSKFAIYDERNNRHWYSILTVNKTGRETDSTGNQFWLIVRKNIIMTFMVRKDWQSKSIDYAKAKMRVDYVFKDVNKAIEWLGPKNQPKASLPILTIDGVKWMIDANNNVMFKKNKPAEKYDIDSVIDKFDKETQEAILNLL